MISYELSEWFAIEWVKLGPLKCSTSQAGVTMIITIAEISIKKNANPNVINIAKRMRNQKGSMMNGKSSPLVNPTF